jgi:RNA polymerase sigma factor (sigma-70 family)
METERQHSLSDFAFGFDILVNMSETDLQLLTRYTNQRAEDAFAEIVRRHLDLVHSAALRQVRSPELAEEVAQAVFIELARQGHHVPPRTVLAAWLYHVTRRRAIDVVRREAGRRLREQTAQELQAMNATAEDWTHIEPLLDDAMEALEETDRLAVLLRYFQNKPLREVGQAIGVTDDAAQKRVSRAVERLREFFSKQGITVGASGLVLVISANAVQAAPAALSLTISTAATLTGVTLASTGTTAVAKTIAMTTMQKTLIAVALASGVVGTGIGIYAVTSILKPKIGLRTRSVPVANETRFTPVSLEQAAGKPLAGYPPGKDWTAVPQGRQIFGDVPFDVLTKLQLQGIVDATNNRMYPARIIGIPVQQQLARLHLFHGANLPDRVGRPIAALRLRYADGVMHTLFITYGVHVRHWWREYGETDAVRDTNSVLVWSGRSPDSDQKNTTHRLYKSSIDLPASNQPLDSIDIFTLFGDSSYVLLAMTGEAPGTGVETSPVPPADETQFRDDLLVKVSDSAGNPIGGARIRGVAISERTGDDIPLARMDDSLGEPGSVSVDFPTSTRELRLVAAAPGFAARELNLKTSDGRRFAREVSVKLDPGVRVGGFVRDMDGNPVAKAKVEMLRPTHDSAGNVSFFKYEETTSNSQGKWTIREAPELLDNLLFRVTHSNFRPGELEFSGDIGTGRLTRNALLKSQAEFKLAPRD